MEKSEIIKTRGRRSHVPTPETRAKVSALISFGVPRERIARYLKIKEETLVKYYADEIETACDARNAEVAGFLFHAASGKALDDGAAFSDCVRAAMFWLKTRMQWRESGEAQSATPEAGATFRLVKIDDKSD